MTRTYTHMHVHTHVHTHTQALDAAHDDHVHTCTCAGCMCMSMCLACTRALNNPGYRRCCMRKNAHTLQTLVDVRGFVPKIKSGVCKQTHKIMSLHCTIMCFNLSLQRKTHTLCYFLHFLDNFAFGEAAPQHRKAKLWPDCEEFA